MTGGIHDNLTDESTRSTDSSWNYLQRVSDFGVSRWPAYAGLLAAFGLPFIPSTAYLFPITLIFLAAGTAALVFKVRHRRGYGPFLLGVIGSAAVLVGRFVIDARAMTYAGAGFLIAASIWNSVHKRPASACCGRCAPETEQTK